MSKSSVARETVAEKKVKLWAESNGIVCLKIVSSTTGYPDRLFILPNGVHIWIEFKAKGRVPRPRQLYRMRELRNQGALVGWTDDAKDAMTWLKLSLMSAPVSIVGGIVLGSTDLKVEHCKEHRFGNRQ